MDEMSASGQGYETRKEIRSPRELVQFWLDAIAGTDKEESIWRKEADNCIAVYRAGKDKAGDYAQDLDFNILHANVETVLPAIYNSSPTPDIRRRHGDRDPVARVVSQMFERAIAYFQDQYDFDGTMYSVLFDSSVAGRGIARVRYEPYENEQIPSLTCEYVPWRRFRRGKADTWDDMPWIAFEHFLRKDELERIAGKDTVANMSFDYSMKDGDEQSKDDVPDVYKRARVWEIWDKEQRQVLFIAASHKDKPLAVHDDPLQLKDFFPVPKPVMPIHTPGDMTPVCPYSVYRVLAEELNIVTRRIRTIVKQIRVRGAYGLGSSDMSRLAQADDGELIHVEGTEAFAQLGLEKAISWWPIEPQVKALQQLYVHRDQLKSTIYEVTGISDIVRGESKATETATAQQIKTQWGSLRIQKLQNEVQRFARDLYRIKAELLASHFELPQLMQISGVRLLSQGEKAQVQSMAQAGQPVPPEIQRAAKDPSIEEVQPVIADDLVRNFRVDVESDSTIRSDMTRHQKAMQEFLQGSAQYISAATPAVQAGIIPPPVLIEVYSSFARMFKLGKQAEDALESLAEDARDKPQQQKPDPEMEKAKMQMQMEQEKIKLQQQSDQAKVQMEQQKALNDAEMAREKMAADLQLKREEMQMRIAMDQQKAEYDFELQKLKLGAETELKREAAETDAKTKIEVADKATKAKADDGDKRMLAILKPIIESISKQNETLLAAMTAPKEIVRDKNGRPVGVQTRVN